MRSSKSRSRSKANRSRSVGNIVNRVFDSSGPEGKVRGTPQQIIDKYTQLARDAQLGNDRVAAENFQQHAEHYVRMLGEAQREADARREQQENEQRARQQQRDNDRQDRQDRQDQQQDGKGSDRSQSDRGQSERSKSDKVDPGSAPQPDIFDVAENDEADSGLVETPESKPKPKRKPSTRSRAKKSDAAPAEAPAAKGDDAPQPDAPEAAE
ncbi:DUF4167 domain-containing protein [Pseudoruegeria sp. SHC-113]|uniref:DUF4167 domain-containing protein n=1 Tax=Pseudoruegeria sp. SHC-113 TaxID=2855439 RepID=UPI0021BB675D|nr:DUF4167 domain-containing protein [Pseudoruegeria sp. SHC-113]MCT8160611.1 DUF4167 domain-containing protein [Pseudoruegeria sp. SHC-113]